MLRKLLLWSHRRDLSQKKQSRARRRRTLRTFRDISLGMECLESRSMLSANPILSIEADQSFGADTSAAGFFRATFTDTLTTPGETLVYTYSIDWDNDGEFDVSGTTSNFQIQRPFWRAAQALDPIVGRFDVAPIDEDGIPFYTSPGLDKPIKVKLNDTILTTTIDVFDVAPQLFIGDPVDTSTAFEGSPFTLSLPTELPNGETIASWRINWGDKIIPDFGGPTATHVYEDNTEVSFAHPLSTYDVSAVACTEDGDEFFADGTYVVTVRDVAAATTISSPDVDLTIDEGEEFRLDLESIDPGDDPVQGWLIHWKGLSNPAELIVGDPDFVTHEYSANDGGISCNIVAIAFSDDRISSTCNPLTVTVNDVPQDGVFLVEGMLSVIDTNAANDIVSVTQSGTSISVTINGNTTDFNVLDVDEINVTLGSGHDVVVIGSSVTVPITIDGGDGNDFLAGGGGRSVLIGGNGNDILWGAAGDDVLLGGAGDDDLFGGGGNDALVGGLGNDIVTGDSGRDLVIGGENQDALVGGIGEDILIGGATIHGDNISKLDDIMAIWGSAASFNSRVATLTATDGLLEADVAVFADDEVDILIGTAGGRDLVFGDTNPAGDVTDWLMLTAIQDVLIPLA
jgi:Ca2+-binding RTX toxin-like protein